MACTAAALAACGSATVNQPFETAMINYRRTLFLDATPLPPLPATEAKAIVDHLETRLLASPYIGTPISRAEFHKRFDGDFKVADDYNVLSDTFSVVGLSDREQTVPIGKATNAEFLLGVQAFSVPCETCPDGDQVAVVGQMVDARTSRLVWRATLLLPVGHDEASVNKGLNDLSDELVELFNDSLKPKWQRERFHNLTPGLAHQPRPPIPLPTEDHSQFHFETPVSAPSTDAP